MKNTNLTKFKLNVAENVTRLITPFGTIKVASLTDEQAEKILEQDPECRYLEKVEAAAEVPKKTTPKVS